MTTPNPKKPFQKLAPGVYLDANGNGVINAAEVLEVLELEDTTANRLDVIDTFKAMIAESWPPDHIFWRPPGDPVWRAMEV